MPPNLTVCVARSFSCSILPYENNEFDLLGEAYAALLRYKIASTIEAVPKLDGLVLTFTESDFSVIHNSRPDRYPPVTVVAHITRIFAEELRARGKRFVLRSFGSIPQDYEDILAGAAQAAKDFPLEIETKVTPYDFDPFLSINPYLRPMENTGLGVEFDCVGEFLGAGRLPTVNVERIVSYVRAAQERQVDRFVIRLDRAGTSILDTSYEINLHAYHRAIEEPESTLDAIYTEWSQRHWPGCETEMREIYESGIRAVEKLQFIFGNIIFHTFPLDGSLKWVKAAGIFSLFKEDVPLKWQSAVWSILSENQTPAYRKEIVEEKEAALQLADQILARIASLGDRLPAHQQLLKSGHLGCEVRHRGQMQVTKQHRTVARTAIAKIEGGRRHDSILRAANNRRRKLPANISRPRQPPLLLRHPSRPHDPPIVERRTCGCRPIRVDGDLP